MTPTKSIANTFLTLATGLVLLGGCQQEIGPAIEIDPDGIVAGDAVAASIVAVATKDGSADNIIDRSSCTTVLYPVRGIVQEEIRSFQNLEEVEALGAAVLEVEWLFPMEVVLYNHQRVTLATEDDLEVIQDTCVEGGQDPDNECVDFQYPFSVRVFDQGTEDVETREITQDSEAYALFSASDAVTTLRFPIGLVDVLGNEIQVRTNQELVEEVTQRNDLCDEEDIIEFEEVFEAELIALFTANAWRISGYQVDGNDSTGRYAEYTLHFQDDFILQAVGPEVYEGEWEVGLLDTGESVSLGFDTEEPAFVTLNGIWKLIEAQETRITLEYMYSEETVKRLQLSPK